MKLEVWQRVIYRYRPSWRIVTESKLDLRIRSQVANAAQSVSANIAEGYGRRSIKEYIQHLYVALGSLAEVLSRMVALRETDQVSIDDFEEIDALHYEVENKLLGLEKILESKRDKGEWVDRVSEATEDYAPGNDHPPTLHHSITP
jgi:four helix bundle protein